MRENTRKKKETTVRNLVTPHYPTPVKVRSTHRYSTAGTGILFRLRVTHAARGANPSDNADGNFVP